MRIPFGWLLEHGYLKAGAELTDAKGRLSAKVHLHEPQVLREHLLAPVHDEDALDIQPQTRTMFTGFPFNPFQPIPGGAGEDATAPAKPDGDKPADKTTWFNFDRVTFSTGSAEIEAENSDAQLTNLVEILKEYPKVRVEADRIYCRDAPVWTSAGITAGIDLSLALIEQDHGFAIAQGIAQELVVYHRRLGGQSQFAASVNAAPSNDRIAAALSYARDHVSRPFTVEQMAAAADMNSSRTRNHDA